MLEVKKTELVALLVGLGQNNAGKWGDARLLGRAKKLDELSEGAEIDDKKLKKLQKSILKAIKNEDEITLVADEEDAKPAKTEKATKGKGKGKKAAKEEVAEEEEEDEDDEEEEDEDKETAEDDDEEEEEEEPKPAKGKGKGKGKGKSKKAGAEKPAKKDKSKKKDKGPGVIATILEIVTKATKTKPVTKDQIIKQLAKKFPDRDEESMAKTVAVQVPKRINKERNITIQEKEGKYWTK